MKEDNIIEVDSLTKVYDGKVKAVDGISFTMREGEILGLLGPNGAGKTTTLNMLATLLRPTSGAARVNGHDVVKEPDAVRRSIGYVFQDPTLDIELTGRENLDFHGRLYGLNRELRQQRIREVLELVQLTDRANDLVKTYSGGMKRRLEIARGLLHHPKVLFLDEPTLGLDPQTRRSIWDHIENLNQEKNVTIILTTHYTEEADQLCNRILIIDFGRIVALDTPDKLKALLEGDIVSLKINERPGIEKILLSLEREKWIRRVNIVEASEANASINRMIQMMRWMPGGVSVDGMMNGVNIWLDRRNITNVDTQQMGVKSVAYGEGGHEGPIRINLLVDDGGRRIPEIVKLADEAGVGLESVELHKPTLDDVFLSVTGRDIRDERGSFMEMVRRRRIIRQARGRRVGW